MTALTPKIDLQRVPVHIAIIMDGNGRWAKSRGLERTAGHVAGVTSVRNVITAASQVGVRYLTLYAFSTENWKRPQHEVDALLHLIVVSLEKETPDMVVNNVRLNVIGDISRLPEESLDSLRRSLDATSQCTGLQVNLALSYSSRWEIIEAARRIAANVASGAIAPELVDESIFEANLTTAAIPDPDLLIRTGGDSRVSNFLLWQIAYSELYFTNIYWPDFSGDDLLQAIADFQTRERRFGLISEQLEDKNQRINAANKK